ncbi:type IX secretion system membrane protein PorP/SprF [Mariniphaga sediminis]|jgi:type IX secretion system PorP/SprF family membrane protein|uniref:Type IX secretion system membrane protein PorP/SprF n=1 Tax=Mariniphaga sediminis TaxID=1628158 RepID=A0A399D0I7_9BACT|nr:type IX secretion system membrane protein PorP/SprF [Mariniphaga sediminis]RIH64708.1 type IX secretion system membrane protein PorP/SprF [Mariniphaga sediminis]
MKNWIKCLASAILLFPLFPGESHGQAEPVLTQYMFNMQPINPAYAGMWEKIGFSTLVRKQWAGINRSPLTQVFSFHSPTNNEKVGVGLNVTNDHYGLENKLGVFGDYAYEVAITPQARLRLGLKFGFLNYKNPLTLYQLYPDGKYDEAYAEDVDLKFLPNFGIGGFLYEEHYYIGLSIPKMLRNDLKANINNYNIEAQIQTVYLTAGYVFRFIQFNYLIFKPTMMITYNRGLPIQYDIGVNFMLREKLWLGLMNRSGNAISFVSQWIMDNNLRLGFAMDLTYNEIFPYQYGTYEVTLGFDMDFFGRSYIREKFF